MKKVRVVRLSKKGNRGVVLVDGEAICSSLEDDWNENLPNVSCIPAGNYTLKKVQSAKFGWTYTVIGCQPDRDLIRFHEANTQEDVTGCVGLGLVWARIGRSPGLAEAKSARNRFMKAMGDVSEADLEIVECYG